LRRSGDSLFHIRKPSLPKSSDFSGRFGAKSRNTRLLFLPVKQAEERLVYANFL
jgi:hypothetical protein